MIGRYVRNLPHGTKLLLGLTAMLLWLISVLEALALLAAAYYSLNPEALDFFDEMDTHSNAPLAAFLTVVAVVILLGGPAAVFPRHPIRDALLGASILTFVGLNLVLVAGVILGAVGAL
ncbi:MAG: hypothetical protein WD379_01950 [Dehalococcoidia bacterium]